MSRKNIEKAARKVIGWDAEDVLGDESVDSVERLDDDKSISCC